MYWGRFFIVAISQMAQERICIEAIDIDKSLSVRVLDASKRHYSVEQYPYRVREVWRLEYESGVRGIAPFTERDIYVLTAEKLKIVDNETTIADCLRRVSYPVISGNLSATFEGKLMGERGAMYITRDNIPSHSMCFWVCDRDLKREDAHGRVRYAYSRNVITYIGMAGAPDIIPKGTLLHLSLARWWKPKDAPQERSYLQISGIDLPDLSERITASKSPTKRKSKATGQMTEAQITGRDGEVAARKWLECEGFEIVATNWRSGHYEVDIVARREDRIHIVEVKCRRALGLTSPEDAIDERKSHTLLKAATAYIGRYGWEGDTQIDLVAVDMLPDGEKLVRYIPNAVLPRW